MSHTIYLGFGLMSSVVVQGNKSYCVLVITFTDVDACHGVCLAAFRIPCPGLVSVRVIEEGP